MENRRRFRRILYDKVIVFFVVAFVMLVSVAALWIVSYPILISAIEREEKSECVRWQQQAKEIEIFWLTPWQKEQCDTMGIEINAPVKGGG